MIYIISEAGAAAAINTALANLAFKEYREGGVFQVISHPSNGFTALSINDLEYSILIDPESSPSTYTALMGYVDPQAIEAIINSYKIEQVPPEPPSGYVLGRFPFSVIIEGYITTRDNDYMVANGWFE